jgi:poly-D-alanine transfer protein DltD
MATDWRELAKGALLVDGKIDEGSVKLLRKVLYADGVIDRKDAEFLVELHKKAKRVSPAFKRFFYQAIKDNVLQGGTIDSSDATWLKKTVYSNKKLDPEQKKLLKDLKRDARRVSPEFRQLYEKWLGGTPRSSARRRSS